MPTPSKLKPDGPLDSKLRKQLERMVLEAREIATNASREKLESLTVHEGKRGGHVTSEKDIELRNRLRAHARFLGDRHNSQSGAQKIDRLVEECAYQHWHRMLFARFLVENELLIQPETGLAVSMEEIEELAHDEGLDTWELAGQYAQTQLPAIFPPDNPVLELKLASDYTIKLTELVEEPTSDSSRIGLPAKVFVANDSLGWVYQFWQNEENKRANKSEDKIDSTTLPAVTQFFTEDYMVLFLLHNTLGAWHAGKVLAENPSLVLTANSEEELRRAVRLEEAGGYDFEYLRFVRESDSSSAGDTSSDDEGNGPWRPMGETFDGWPKTVAKLKVLDPCCGSGHFLVAALELLVRLRMREERLDLQSAVDAVFRENLFGLELDKRCTQIAVFNLAMAAWKLEGGHYRKLPSMTIAHVGQSVTVKREQWMKVLGSETDSNTKFFFGQLYDMFSQASTLGSLINPRRFLGSHQLDEAGMEELIDVLESAVAADPNTEADSHELQLAAKGLATATKLLADQYHLVITNVPYLARGKQSSTMQGHIETFYKLGRSDLATAFLLRCLEFSRPDGTAAIVCPQNWLFLPTYKGLRKKLLTSTSWNLITRLGPKSFQTPMWDFNVQLCVISAPKPENSHRFGGLDVGPSASWNEKKLQLETSGRLENYSIDQSKQLENSALRIVFQRRAHLKLLRDVADFANGLQTSDYPRYVRGHWEVEQINKLTTRFFQSTVKTTREFDGCEQIVFWGENGELITEEQSGAVIRGTAAWGRPGVAISAMGQLKAAFYTGSLYDDNTVVVTPKNDELLPLVWACCSAEDYSTRVREVDQALKVRRALLEVPFDEVALRKKSESDYPNGLPEPESDDPTQWLFHGWPSESTHPLHVAVGRMLGYRWPAELDSEMRLSDRARELVARCDELDSFTDDDGIVCIPSLRGEDTAAHRLGPLLNACGVSTDEDLDDWFRNRFFKEHCELFDHRPFIWHIWDGRKRDGFHALVNYHKLAGPSGHKVLERLTYSYLGDWIERQGDEVKRQVSGSEGRLEAAMALKERLESILTGEPPYDIFVRWKPIYEQPIGWNPDINDGVRINIRPFMQNTIDGGQKDSGILRFKPKRTKWGKDRGKEPKRPIDDYPWFWSWDEQTENFTGGDKFDGLRWNDLHYSNKVKQRARDKHKES